MNKRKHKQATVRIRTDQYDALLKLATKQQMQRGVPVTVGMVVRGLLDKELGK